VYLCDDAKTRWFHRLHGLSLLTEICSAQPFDYWVGEANLQSTMAKISHLQAAIPISANYRLVEPFGGRKQDARHGF
jgi:hypothetical protein